MQLARAIAIERVDGISAEHNVPSDTRCTRADGRNLTCRQPHTRSCHPVRSPWNPPSRWLRIEVSTRLQPSRQDCSLFCSACALDGESLICWSNCKMSATTTARPASAEHAHSAMIKCNAKNGQTGPSRLQATQFRMQDRGLTEQQEAQHCRPRHVPCGNPQIRTQSSHLCCQSVEDVADSRIFQLRNEVQPFRRKKPLQSCHVSEPLALGCCCCGQLMRCAEYMPTCVLGMISV